LFDYSEFTCKWIAKAEIWKCADVFSAKYWPEETLPVDMEKIIEDRLKLNIEPKHGLLSQIDTDGFLKRDLTGIIVDHDCYMQDRFQNRTRFSFAHELGHFVLHSDIYSELPISSPEDWKDFVLNMPDKEYSSFEWQANEFAGRLLVPRQRLISELEKIFEVIKEHELIGYLKEDPKAVLSRISPTLCKPFGVSSEVIETRVEREELWPPNLKS